MKAMILAAGEGRRMLPLTRHTPKPLLSAGGKALIVHQIEKLARAGICELVINHAYLGERIESTLEDGRRFGVRIDYSREGEPLETAGGIIRALPLLGDAPFIVVNADIWTDYSYSRLPVPDGGELLAHLVMVPNAPHHPGGDFFLTPQGRLAREGDGERLTYSGIGVFHPDFFAGYDGGFLPLRPLLDRAIAAGRVAGEIHAGAWTDVGTPERLRALDARLSAAPDEAAASNMRGRGNDV